jgi:hypothetical protein
MIARIRWRPVLVVVGGAVVLSKIAWPQTMPATSPPVASVTGEQWQTTDRSMLDFVEDGYELVSVVGATTSQTRLYFLSKPGKIVKCREESTLSAPPPIPPPPPIRGQVPTFVPDTTAPDTRIETECAELSRAPPAKH